MALMSDVDLPAAHVREQIAQTIDVVVHMRRLPEGRRVVDRISTLEAAGGDRPSLRDIFDSGFGPSVPRLAHRVASSAGASR